PVDPSLEEWVRLAQSSNLAIKIAELDLAAREDDAKAAKARLYPTLTIGASYNWNQSDLQRGQFFVGEAFEQSSVGVTLTAPIFAGGLNRARLRQAYYTRDASEEALLFTQRTNTQNTR